MIVQLYRKVFFPPYFVGLGARPSGAQGLTTDFVFIDHFYRLGGGEPYGMPRDQTQIDYVQGK